MHGSSVGWRQSPDIAIVFTEFVNTIVMSTGGPSNLRCAAAFPAFIKLPSDAVGGIYFPAPFGNVSLGVREYISVYDPSPHESRNPRLIGKKGFVVAKGP